MSSPRRVGGFRRKRDMSLIEAIASNRHSRERDIISRRVFHGSVPGWYLTNLNGFGTFVQAEASDLKGK